MCLEKPEPSHIDGLDIYCVYLATHHGENGATQEYMSEECNATSPQLMDCSLQSHEVAQSHIFGGQKKEDTNSFSITFNLF